MDKLGGYDWRGMLKKAQDKVKQYTLNLTDLELKVEDATSNETWGPHGSTMTGANWPMLGATGSCWHGAGGRPCGSRR